MDELEETFFECLVAQANLRDVCHEVEIALMEMSAR
jgi:hypothetical protein